MFTWRGVLDCFLDFLFEMIPRKSAFQLRQVEARSHIVQGLLAAQECMDDVIDMIRPAPDQNGVREDRAGAVKRTGGRSPQVTGSSVN